MNQEYVIDNNTGEDVKFIREKNQPMAYTPHGFKWVQYADSWYDEYRLIKIEDTQR